MCKELPCLFCHSSDVECEPTFEELREDTLATLQIIKDSSLSPLAKFKDLLMDSVNYD